MPMNPRLLRPTAATGFNPKKIAGLVAWWDWSDASTVTLNGSNISETADKSGNGHTLVQPVAASQPPYTGTINGKKARGEGSLYNNTTFSVSQPNTFFFAGQVTTLHPSGSRRLFDNTISGARQTVTLFNTGEVAMFGGTFLFVPGSGVVGSGDRFVSAHTFSGASSRVRLNGTTITTGNPGTNNLAAIAIGAQNTTSVEPFPGLIGECLMYGSLSIAEIQSIEAYLKKKWGTP